MSADIITINSEKNINDKKAICSALPTGKFASLLVRPETSLTISSIENKFDQRFDDPSYYYGGGLSDGGYYSGS